MLGNDVINHAGEFCRALRNGRVEQTDTGVLFVEQNVHVHGSFTTWVNGRDEQVDPNVVTLEGLTYMLSSALDGAAQLTLWHLAPFSGNVTPTSAYTAANFATNATEFTAYDEATRVLMDPGTITSSLSNTASRADFTMAAGVLNQTIYGAGLLSSSTKASTTGKLFSASRFATPRMGLNEGDVMSVLYELSSSST